jgi:DNA-binding transcriptional ArsR family regulator
VGARADILCELLARRAWVTASGLTHLGYSKRGIARVLAELGEARLAVRRERGNAHAYRLRDRGSLVRLVGGSGLAWPRWWELLLLVHRLVLLDDLAPKAPQVRRVGAHGARKELRKLALAVELAEPPATAGVADAFERLTSWGVGVIRSTRTAAEVDAPSR